MSWSIGYDATWKRDIGYGVPAPCDHPGCFKEIDRGLAHVCGGQPYGGEKGCGLYFCGDHHMAGQQLCERCREGRGPFDPKPDLAQWTDFKHTDASWAGWRAESRPTIISADGIYRYTLWRDLDDVLELEERAENKSAQYVNFIMLNPSTASASVNDPTIRRCIDYAQRWGYGALCVTNLFAYRTVSPKVLKMQREPIGEFNHQHIVECATNAGLVVAAWGTDGRHRFQDAAVKELLVNSVDLHCLGLTKDKHPSHPLYLKADLKPIPL